MGQRKTIRFALITVLLIAFFGLWSQSAYAQPSIQSNALRAQGDHLVNGLGQTITLRGAELDTALMYKQSWDNGKMLSDKQLTTIFYQMSQVWKMKAVRIPTSLWIYNEDNQTYLNELDKVVTDANDDGLYVILGMHDDAKAGSSYGDCATYPKQEDVTYWNAIATHYKGNPMVLYDVFNEPNYPTNYQTWSEWLNGGDTPPPPQGCSSMPPIVGFSDLVQAIRSTGVMGVIIVEPGNAGKDGGNSENGGWTTFSSQYVIQDSNVMYSLHIYQDITDGPGPNQGTVDPAALDSKWGPILGNYPTYYGEWAFLGIAVQADHCPTSLAGNSTYNTPQGTQPGEADKDVQNFLTYMARAGTGMSASNWTAWQFAQDQLLADEYQTYTPSQFPTTGTSWTCPEPSGSGVGMGADVQAYLLSQQP